MQSEQAVQLTTAGKAMLAGNSLTGFGYVWGWLGQNNDSITSLCTIIGLFITGVAAFYSIRRNRRD